MSADHCHRRGAHRADLPRHRRRRDRRRAARQARLSDARACHTVPMNEDADALRIALAQINPTVGDIDGNARDRRVDRPRPRRGRRAGRLPRALHPRLPGRGPLPEARTSSTPTGARSRSSRATSSGIAALVGFAEPARRRDATPTTRSPCSPTARCAASTARTGCPTTASSTSSATSSPATSRRSIEVAGARVGLTICEDFWDPGPPASARPRPAPRLIANPSASPVPPRQGRRARAMFAERARDYGAHFAFCNLVGGQDELVFDGHSFVVDAGETLARARSSRRSCCSVRASEPLGRLRRSRCAPLDAPGPRLAPSPLRSSRSPRSTRR